MNSGEKATIFPDSLGAVEGKRHPRPNGFVERFNRTVLDEFFRSAFRNKLFESAEALQTDLDTCLHCYNYERPHRGYRNQGRRPIETMALGKRQREELAKEPA